MTADRGTVEAAENPFIIVIILKIFARTTLQLEATDIQLQIVLLKIKLRSLAVTVVVWERNSRREKIQVANSERYQKDYYIRRNDLKKEGGRREEN